MKITELIAQHLFEVHEGNNWTDVDLTGTLTDISFQETFALAVPCGRPGHCVV